MLLLESTSTSTSSAAISPPTSTIASSSSSICSLPATSARWIAANAGKEGNIVVAQIKELLDTRVRPAVAGDGGDIVFRGFRDGVVRLHMQGACSGCPSSSATLKAGVEQMMRHYVPEVTLVEQTL